MGCAQISHKRRPFEEIEQIEIEVVPTTTPNIENPNTLPPRRVRPRLQLSIYDTGYLPSSESDNDTPTPTNKKNPWEAQEILPENQNAMQCYFCFEKNGLLLTMPLCRCRQFAHKKCLMTYVGKLNIRCSICKEFYCEMEEKESKLDMVQRVMTVIKDREALFQRKIFINSIIGVT
jgi:hypothetical protein